MDTQELDISLNKNDFKILLEVKKKPQSIMVLQNQSMLAYKNFKSHLDKLEKYKLLKIKRQGKGKPAIVDLTDLALEVLKLGIAISKK